MPLSARDLVISAAQAPLLADCSDASGVVATLPQGHKVRLRFAIAGASNRCYSVAAEFEGRTVAGYISRDAVTGLDEFEQTRRDASVGQLAAGAARSIQITAPPASAAPKATPTTADESAAIQAGLRSLEEGRPQDTAQLLAALPANSRDAAVLRAQAFLQMTRAADAWAALQPAMTAESANDPAILGLAGVAAFQQDRMAQARQYLKQSLALEQNASLEQLYAKIQLEESQDQSHEAAYGSRFVMKYEGQALPQEAARSLAKSFDSEMTRITRQLNCPMNDRLVVNVQALDSYRRSTGAAEWSGGSYDGRIHIAVPPSGQADAHVRSTFAHEFVHACLSRMGNWPGWLHEGLAQQLSGRRLEKEERLALAAMQSAGKLPTLEQLGNGWARMGAHESAVAYALALGAAQILHQDLQDYGLRELLNQPARLKDVEKQLDKKLQAAFSH